jgi:hypothetical protein
VRKEVRLAGVLHDEVGWGQPRANTSMKYFTTDVALWLV